MPVGFCGLSQQLRFVVIEGISNIASVHNVPRRSVSGPLLQLPYMISYNSSCSKRVTGPRFHYRQVFYLFFFFSRHRPDLYW